MKKLKNIIKNAKRIKKETKLEIIEQEKLLKLKQSESNIFSNDYVRQLDEIILIKQHILLLKDRLNTLSNLGLFKIKSKGII